MSRPRRPVQKQEPPHPGESDPGPELGVVASQAINAERAVIGTVLLHPELVNRVGSLLSPEDFSDFTSRVVWGSIESLAIKGLAPDPLAVLTDLHARQIPGTRSIDRLTLTSFVDLVVSPRLVDQHAKSVKAASRLRSLGRFHEQMRLALEQPGATAEQTLAWAQERLGQIDRDTPATPKKLPRIRVENVPDPGPITWLIDGLWVEGAFGFLGAIPKSWKSFFTLQMAISVASGMPLFGRHAVRRRGSVLIFSAEGGGKKSVRRRLGAMCRALDVDLVGLDVEVLDLPVLHLDKPDVMASFVATVQEAKPALVILDPLRELHTGDENDSAYIASLLAPLRELQHSVGCAIAIVHHNVKPPQLKKDAGGRRASEDMRGSGALSGALDSGIFLTAIGTGPEKLVNVEVLHRDEEEIAEFSIRLRKYAHNEGLALRLDIVENDDDGPDDVEVAMATRDRLMNAAIKAIRIASRPGSKPLRSATAIVNAIGIGKQIGLKLVKDMTDAGLITQNEDGDFRLCDIGANYTVR